MRQFPESFDQTRPATPVRRLGALLYDFMITVALWMLIGAIAVAFNQGESTDVEKPALLQSVLLILTYLFFAFFWTRNGQTLGLQAWRLRVQTPEGAALSWWQALLRYISAMLSWGTLGLGYLWMFIDRDGLSLHDRLSGTCVVELPKKDRKKKD
ncbi:MAG: RDD family protein [Marinobacterium sp.]|nr:RDD family protein [Marinobacterium sp.]